MGYCVYGRVSMVPTHNHNYELWVLRWGTKHKRSVTAQGQEGEGQWTRSERGAVNSPSLARDKQLIL